MKFAWFLAYAFSLLCTGLVPVASTDAAQFDAIEVPGDRTSGTTAVAIGLDGATVVGSGTAYGFVWTNGTMTNPCSFFTQGQTCRFTGVRGNSMAATVIHNNDATSLVYWAAGLGPYQPPCPDPNANCSAGTMVGPDAFVVKGSGSGWINLPNGASSMYEGPWIPAGANSAEISGTSSDASWVVGTAQYPGIPTGWYAYNGADKICNLDPQGVLSVVVQGVSDEGVVVIGRANGMLNSRSRVTVHHAEQANRRFSRSFRSFLSARCGTHTSNFELQRVGTFQISPAPRIDEHHHFLMM